MGKGSGNQIITILGMLISLLLGYAFGATRKEGTVSIKLFSSEVRITIVRGQKDDAVAKDESLSQPRRNEIAPLQARNPCRGADLSRPECRLCYGPTFK